MNIPYSGLGCGIIIAELKSNQCANIRTYFVHSILYFNTVDENSIDLVMILLCDVGERIENNLAVEA